MATIASIKKQIADLERKATALLKAESAKTIAKVKALIERHGLTAEDLGFGEKGAAKAAGGKAAKTAKTTKRAAKGRKGAAAKTVGVPMYRDAKSGKTWTGRGKPPNWIAGAKDRSKFLIEAATAAAAPAARPSEAKPKKAKAARARKASASKPVERKAASKKPKPAGRAASGATTKAPVKPTNAIKAIPSAPSPNKSAGAKLAKGRKAAPPPPAPALVVAPTTS
jgi:DNA-binding protein H-NS